MFLGLSHTPRSDKGEIAFNINDPESYKKIVDSMDDILKKYEITAQEDALKYEDCGGKCISYCMLNTCTCTAHLLAVLCKKNK